MAELDKTEFQTKKSKTLIIRHLPRELNRDEKEDLLKYFGASSVRVLSEKGPLKHMAFATFSSETLASKALSRLHQLRILGHTLVVEFARDQDAVTVLKDPPVSDSGADAQVEKEKKEKQQHNIPLVDNSIAPNLGLKFQTNPTLKYLYPPPSSGVLTNIAHTLLSVPKFYVQVLHLMNKMNLPCPFGPVTAPPPMFEMPRGPLPPMPPPYPPENPPLPVWEEGGTGSEEESEYESGDDEDKERMIKLMGLVNQPCKRQLRAKTSKRKKPKLKDLLFTPKPDSHGASGPVLQPADVFEQPQPLGQKKIEFHLSAEVSAILVGPGENQESQSTDVTEGTDKTEVPTWDAPEGFGKIYPSAQLPRQEEDKEEDEDIPSEFISRRELERGRLSRDEIKKMSVFKNYEPGEPTCRLYVKNIPKQVEEKDLKFIYGRYVDISSEEERNMFDIVLMKEGRMKGQAFIGLPSERSAEKALKETNGFILHDKPLVVQFARSAKPKQDSADPKKGGKKH
ncbi:RNA-binding region-containing protein 3 [Myxocyprinus asiaticus]|uniref:RNA-binding region-containing protein 3 n=1 Tax=Myxocyprinus asiaticus TaxID=70543 RepID=UPI002223E76C|nr:RNA-binding region-containing protein 3 [Myxocyprinus asiaticus]XP_051543232.1 RNA-binding region-containing protein 3 [Myxocyprinus asiaticus]